MGYAIVTANIIDIISNPSEHNLTEFSINLLVAILTVIQNLPTQMLHMKYLCKPVGYVEAELRSNLVRKLQIMSISSHNELKSGKLQSKILRDVEAIQFLSTFIEKKLIQVETKK